MPQIVARGLMWWKDEEIERWVGRTEEENKALVKSIGGNTNAATFYNYTKYYITTKSEMTST